MIFDISSGFYEECRKFYAFSQTTVLSASPSLTTLNILLHMSPVFHNNNFPHSSHDSDMGPFQA